MLQEVEADLKEVVQGLVDVTGRRRWEGQEVQVAGIWGRGGWGGLARRKTGRPERENVRADSDGSEGSDGSVHTPSLVARWLLVHSLVHSLARSLTSQMGMGASVPGSRCVGAARRQPGVASHAARRSERSRDNNKNNKNDQNNNRKKKFQ
jgi:hypothetical protein